MTSPAPRAPSRDSSFSDEAVRQRRAVQQSRGAPAPASAPSVSQGTSPAAPPASSKGSAPAQSIGRQNYQPIILMEYIGCLLLTAVTPIATKKSANGLSPYAGADMVKLASITLLYFILAAMSVGGRGPGRMAAWFGGLILIVDGMLEASNIAKDFGLFTGGLARAATGTSTSTGSTSG